MERPPLDARGLAGLIRPRIAGLVLVVAAAGFLLERPDDLAPLPWLLVGTLLVAAAGCALNHYAERDIDANMERTRYRPLVTGALTPHQVLLGGLTSMVVGLVLLFVGAGTLSAALEALALFIYLGVYTPLKRRTSSNTWIGAIPGALPLLVGAAAGGGPSTLSWIAFGLLFLWQLPHFFAIASMYRDDYVSGGLRMLSGEDPEDALLRWQMPLQVMSVMLLSFMPSVLGLAGPAYAAVAVLVGAVFLFSAFAFRRHPDRSRARGVVLASVAYLPLVMGALVLDVSCSPVDEASEHAHDLMAEGEHCADCDVTADGEEIMSCELCLDDELADAADGSGEGGLEDDDTEDADDLLARLTALSAAAALPEIEDGTGLANFGELPAFALIDDRGSPFGKDALMGSPWVVDFIFTTCAGPCPVMSQKFMELEKQGLEADFLSITVDPRRDGPEELRAYRDRHGGSDENWRLLTGTHGDIQALAEVGFRLPVNAGEEPVAGMAPMFHSGKFALLDRSARVRGYYDYRDRLEMEQLLEDAAALAAVADEE
jgi:protoheme IX farnesyltransferase